MEDNNFAETSGQVPKSTNKKSTDELLPLVYDELRRLAASHMARENPGQTLTATALVHEAYERLSSDKQPKWESPGHFFSAAAESMRRILIESARRKKTAKRGGGQNRISYDSAALFRDSIKPDRIIDLIDFDAALTMYEREYPEKAKLVKFRYFLDVRLVDAAQLLGISESTAKRHWRFSKAWFLDFLSK